MRVFWASLSVRRYGWARSKEGIILGMNYVIFLSGNSECSQRGCASRAAITAGGVQGKVPCPHGHSTCPQCVPGPQPDRKKWEWQGAPIPAPSSSCSPATLVQSNWGRCGVDQSPSPSPWQYPGGSGLCDMQSISRIGANGTGGSTG